MDPLRRDQEVLALLRFNPKTCWRLYSYRGGNYSTIDATAHYFGKFPGGMRRSFCGQYIFADTDTLTILLHFNHDPVLEVCEGCLAVWDGTDWST